MSSAIMGTRLMAGAALIALTLTAGCASLRNQLGGSSSASATSAGTVTRAPDPSSASPAAPASAQASQSGSAATPATSPEPPLGKAGGFQVTKRTLTFTEPARTTKAGQRIGPRTLVTEVWYPRSGGHSGRFPMVVFAPGFLQCPDAYAGLLRGWATAGYVVAAVTFPRTNCHLAAKAYEPDLVNQPRDMSYVLTSLLKLSGRPGDPLSGLVDPDEVGAAGQSDGGDTVAALAANTCCADYRFQAVAVLSGAEWAPMPGRYFTDWAAPMLFTQGSADKINPPSASLRLYGSDHDGVRYYLDLIGASHLPPYEGTGSQERITARVTLAFFNRYLLGQASALKAMVQDGTVPGAAALVGGGKSPP